jgi:hypothetical protein
VRLRLRDWKRQVTSRVADTWDIDKCKWTSRDRVNQVKTADMQVERASLEDLACRGGLVVWPQNHRRRFGGFASKPSMAGFLDLRLKT